MVFLCCVAARGGIEGIGRATQIIIPFSVVMFVLLIAFLVPEFEVLQLLPILENGIVPSLKGAITPQGWFAEELLITFMLPLLSDANKAMKWGNISVISVMLTLVVTNLTILFMYGTDLSRYTYPLLSAVRYVSFADFFENVEAAIVAIWILGNFIKFTFIHYAIVIGTAQLLNLSDYRLIVWPMGLITCLISFWSLPNQMVLTQYSTFVFPHYSLMYQTILPLMLLLVAAWRTRTRNPKGEPLS
jgi:spore germination protein KB